LTLWLDPGRIKRELIPNQKLGAPLQKGRKYSIAVSGQWESAQGLAINRLHTKNFITTARDSISPQPLLWKLQLPKEGTLEPLTMTFNEALDYFLLQETVSILNNREEAVKGSIKLSGDEKSLQFVPQQKWQKGKHIIRVASYLEDLAGNSIERPFDRDIRLPKTATVKSFIDKEFEVKD
ncbi:MAG TPA: Ig-like domain-containing protein, partial [Chitinophagaceae bacterium]|nr:Ig-like domain-containing protein [Chitinophagaceae bacterium]